MDITLNIGIVEDNDDLRESIAEVLAGAGHSVEGFSCAEDLVVTSGSEPLELLLLDLNLPGEDGLSLAGRLRRVHPGLRVIMMTTRTAVQDRVRGYDVGADLYLTKPVAEDELLAAVRALGRQIHAEALQVASRREVLFELDARSRQLRGQGGVAMLNSAEVALLAALACAPGQRLEHWQLLEALGTEVDDASKANLAVRMTRLRGKLSEAGCPGTALRALRASGYQLCIAVEIR